MYECDIKCSVYHQSSRIALRSHLDPIYSVKLLNLDLLLCKLCQILNLESYSVNYVLPYTFNFRSVSKEQLLK